MERLPANDRPSLDYGEAGANGREISIKRKSFALICVVRGHIVFTFTRGDDWVTHARPATREQE